MWNGFLGKRDMYARDGVHMSRKVVELMSEWYESGVKECVRIRAGF